MKAGYVSNAGYEVKTEFTGRVLSEVVAMRGYALSVVADETVLADEETAAAVGEGGMMMRVYTGPACGTSCALEPPCFSACV